MENDYPRLKALLDKHVPGGQAYDAVNHRETDLQLRRIMAGEMEKVRDRLAEFVAQTPLGALKENFGAALREAAAFKDEVLPRPEDRGQDREFSAEGGESLLDLDLALLERVAALHTPLDRMEAGGALEEPLEQFNLGLREIFDLFRERARLFRVH